MSDTTWLIQIIVLLIIADILCLTVSLASAVIQWRCSDSTSDVRNQLMNMSRMMVTSEAHILERMKIQDEKYEVLLRYNPWHPPTATPPTADGSASVEDTANGHGEVQQQPPTGAQL